LLNTFVVLIKYLFRFLVQIKTLALGFNKIGCSQL